MDGPDLARHETRFLPLSGTMNTRDLGGLPLPGGGVTRSGHFLRSDLPRSLPTTDQATLARLGLGTVIDLRQPFELARERSALVGRDGYAVHQIEVWIRNDELADPPLDPWSITEFYLGLLDHAGEAFAAAVQVLADANGAALFHCTAGKDRTGLLALLLLDVAGVERPAMIEDFVLTDARIEPIRERLLIDADRRGIPRADFARLLGATADLIEPALEQLDRRYGGAAAYLQRHGVQDATLAKIREKLAG